MKLKMNGFWTAGVLAAAAIAVSGVEPRAVRAQSQPAAPAKPAPASDAGQKPTFSVQIDLVTNDVIVRDGNGNFVPDLKKDEFEILEDGVPQDISSMTVVTGGRVTNVLAPPPPPPPEGIILPPKRQTNDASGRIFLFFVDDLHMDFQNTPRIRDLFKRMAKNLLHDGDMWGMVSSGPSSIAIDMNYDRQRFTDALNKITGNGLKPIDIINGPDSAEGPSEVRYRAHVAFSTVSDALNQLEKVHNRRKAFVWVSDGYDFNPFADSRTGTDPNGVFAGRFGMNQTDSATDPITQAQKASQEFSDADLVRDLADVTRAANRANATLYTIDPRGLVGGPDIEDNINPTEWQDYVRKSQDSLRVLAAETGGIAVVNQNDFDKALKRIDAETSDYYVLGYYSKNPDPTKRRRIVDVRVTRPGLKVMSRKEYVLQSVPAPKAPAPEKKADKK